jgi:predicted ABC-type ATPase
MSDKVLVVFAGPNGSGKSTIISEYIAAGRCPSSFICPDNFVDLTKKYDVEAFRAAQRKADSVRQLHVEQGKSFSFETVLSIPDKLEFIKKAKYHGYYVHVVYVTTKCTDINLQRIALRVSQGGHDVPHEKVISRYEKTMNLMFDVIQEAHSAEIYDNSEAKPRRVIIKKHKYYIVIEKPNNQLEKYIISKATDAEFPIIKLYKTEGVSPLQPRQTF